MSFKRFQQFLEQKANKWTLPEKTEPVYPAKGKHIKPDEYYSPGAKKDPGLMTADDKDRGTPFGHTASPGMGDPKKIQPYGEKPAPAPKKLPKRSPKIKKMKNEALINKTANLSDRQFTNIMLENNRVRKIKLTDLNGKKFTPEPAETMGYVANLMTEDENVMARMVREIKRRGGMHSLISEIFSHPESFSIVEQKASKDARINRKLFEAVAEPRGGGDTIGPSGATAGGPLTARKVKGGGGMPSAAPGGGMPAAPGGGMPPAPPGLGEEEEMDDTKLLDDEDGDLDLDDEENEDGDEKHHHHHHGSGDMHVHHHHHKDDDDDEKDLFSDEDDDENIVSDEDDDENVEDDTIEKDDDNEGEELFKKNKGNQATSGSLLGGGEKGSGLGKGSLTL